MSAGASDSWQVMDANPRVASGRESTPSIAGAPGKQLPALLPPRNVRGTWMGGHTQEARLVAPPRSKLTRTQCLLSRPGLPAIHACAQLAHPICMRLCSVLPTCALATW